MRTTRLITTAALTVVALLPGAVPAQAATRPKPVSMTFSASPASVERGTVVTLTGRAAYGNGGNAAPVDIYFRKAGTTSHMKIATTAAASDGTFRRTVKATASGWYRAVYRGSRTRQPASRYDGVAVHVTTTARQTVYQHQEVGYSCLRGTECPITSPDVTIAAAPLMVSFTVSCVQPVWTATLAFTDSPTHTPPDGAMMPAAPGWRWLAWHTPVPSEFDLAPALTRGRFYMNMTSGKLRGGEGPVTCDFSFTAWQAVTRKVRL